LVSLVLCHSISSQGSSFTATKLHERAIMGGPFALRVRAARSCDAEHLPRN
jgi:hypothetical protein